MASTVDNQRYINRADLRARVNLSDNTIRNLETQNRFPKRRTLSARSVRWWLPDVEAWLRDPEGWRNNQAS